MIKYAYYAALALYGIMLLIALYYYLSKPAPSGDATVDWALGIYYAGALAVVVAIALLCWKHQSVGVVVLCSPLVFAALPAIRSTFRNWYARAPTLQHIPALSLQIDNTTKAKVHVQVGCWFGPKNASHGSLYQTLDYTLEPLERKNYPLSDYETGLLAQKSNFVSVQIYELVTVHYEETTYQKEIQPSMQFYNEKIEAFRDGAYTIRIDSSNNTETFKSEVEMLKESDNYGSGVF